MAKRFKLRISRVMTSFQSCRSKDSSTLPADPVPSFLRLDFPHQPVTQPPSKPGYRSSFKSHVSSAFTSVGCGFRSNRKSGARSHTKSPPEFMWQKEDKWHVVAKAYNDDDTPRQKVYNSSASGNSGDELFSPPPPPTEEKKKLRIKKKKTTVAGRLRISTSSVETGLFSSEAEEESETLVSTSRSFSTSDSSMSELKTIREISTSRRRVKKNRKKEKREKVGGGGGRGEVSPARLSVFKRLIPCAVEGKVKESFAVVKKSENPYEDFKRSMMEMIMEKMMFEERELEQLLQCFLSLNSRQHHGAIVEAFSHIWEALFSSTNNASTTSRTSL